MGLDFELSAIIEPELAAGHFTDAYISCGTLDQSKVFFSKAWYSGKGRIFDLASLTKALVTGPLVFWFLKKAQLSFVAPLEAWGSLTELPEVIRNRTAAELLGHFSGLPAWWNFWITHLNEVSPRTIEPSERHKRTLEVLRRVPLDSPGNDLYSDIGYITLGYALEVLQNRNLQELWEAWTSQLGKTNHQLPMAFRDGIVTFDQTSFIPTSFCQLRKRLLQGEVHDENCAALGGIAGHAGLFGSGESLDVYLLSLYSSSIGQEYLSLNYEKLLNTEREGLLGMRRGTVASALPFGHGRAMGHLGFTGTAFWIDWEKKVFGTFLTNRVCSGRIPTRMGEVRSQVFGKLYEALS